MQDVFDQAQQMGRLWTEFASRMVGAGMAAPADAPPTDAARQVRSAAVQAMSQSAEEIMRSPQFLEMVRQGMENAITWREQLNTFFTRAHHSTQGVAMQDIDTVVLSVKQFQTRMLGRLEELSRRLDQIDRRLDALTAVTGNGNNNEEKPDAAPPAAKQGDLSGGAVPPPRGKAPKSHPKRRKRS